MTINLVRESYQDFSKSDLWLTSTFFRQSQLRQNARTLNFMASSKIFIQECSNDDLGLTISF